MSLRFYRQKAKRSWFPLVVISLIMMRATVAHAGDYYSNKSLRKRLASIAERHQDLVRTRCIAQSLSKHKIWLVTVGQAAETERKTWPAMLLVAGIEGNDLTGCSLAVSWIEHLAEQYEADSQIRDLLDTTIIYVVPRLNPDAAEHFFRPPKCETSLNGQPVDADHDGLVDEDGPEDLNGDGLITWMRVEDPEGEYILDPVDDRLLVEADRTKGEIGGWRYSTEGIDNDHDERWNEDGPGGVNFNRNFPYNYRFFAPDAGLHQVSEAETRALAEFVIGHPNIGIVFTYGAANNLLETPKAAPYDGRRKPMTAIDQNDLPYYRVMGEMYRESLGLTKELPGTSEPGTFSDWMYFHRGRLSLAARPWSPAVAVELSEIAEEKEETKCEKLATEEAASEGKQTQEAGAQKESEPATEKCAEDASRQPKADKDDRNEKERKELKWFDEHAPDAFIEWQPIEHPDFPGQRVEVGGYRPFSRSNPPAKMIEDIAAKHADFLTRVAQRLPRIGIRKVETQHLGEGVYEVEIQVENTGFLPTSLAHGETTREVYPTRLVIDLDNKHFLSGSRVTRLPTIPGSSGMVEARYVVHVRDRGHVDFTVVSMLAGQVEGAIELAKD